MAADGFFSRWSRRKAEAAQQTQQKVTPSSASAVPAEPVAEKPLTTEATRYRNAEPSEPVNRSGTGAPDGPAGTAPQPTLEDVARLPPDSDFSAFVARGVDEAVRRQALKKLFSDPHFNVMDGLDIYIDDYNKFEPIPPQMLASLEHAKSTLNPLAQLEKPLMQLTQDSADAAAGATDAPAPEPEADNMPSAEAADGTPAPSEPAGPSGAAPALPDGGDTRDDAASTDKISDDPSNDHTV